MTRKDAIYTLECIAVDLVGSVTETKEPMLDVLRQRIEAINIAQFALRPVSRERVERVWKSEWVDNGERDSNGVPKPFAISCKRCGSSAGTTWMSFCPTCGAPMTDEAVQMVMERLEAMKE